VITHLIINSPYEEPSRYWSYDRETRLFELKEGARRPAGYVKASERSRSFDDPGIFVELPLVNQIRPRVKAWREAGYAGVTGITKRLLEHWRNPEEREGRQFFFCQLEAVETLIWLTEAPPAETQGIAVPGDGGPFQRLCCKMATGSGKTVVMAMVIAWQILNKVNTPQDKRFSKHVFVVAPGLTVKNRLQVLMPAAPGNFYDEFSVVPSGLLDKLRQGMVRIRNWHALNWETEERLAKKKGVDKRGAKSDEAYVREVLGEMANAQNIVVINDEAHHAWRVPAHSRVQGVSKEDIEEATKWIGGLDRIHKMRGISNCFDFSATPFAPSGKQSTEEALFPWAVSDFGLNDAIEAGLVKTPRVVIRDDALPDTQSFKSKLYHIYDSDDVKDDLNRRAEPHEPLPDLVSNAYYLLGVDWLKTAQDWEKAGSPTPPVMITVANRTETAARVKYAFDNKRIRIDELCDPERTLHIDSSVLEEAEAQEEAQVPVAEEVSEEETGSVRKLTKQQRAELLRKTVDTVGQPGKPGELIQNVISVGMLTEGWDAKTVTHIMGLRAFSSQLLCEQVVGRGLRRTSYDVNPETRLFEPEYVNIFGVPFTFLPHEGGEGLPPPPPQSKTRIEPLLVRAEQYEITWPNVLRIERVYSPQLAVSLDKVPVLELNASDTPMLADMAPVIAGKPDVTKIEQISLEELGRKQRMQRIVFETARDVFEQMKPDWKGTREHLIVQLVGIVEKFLASDRIRIHPELFSNDPLHRRILLTLNMTRLVQHLFSHIRQESTESLAPVFDHERPIRSTGDMRPWYTGRPCIHAAHSHINQCVVDGTWEAAAAEELDRNPRVIAWAKNDHLGFEILYIHRGAVRKYRPDFLIRLSNTLNLVLEIKGQDNEESRAKRPALEEWIQAVNGSGGFGLWSGAVAYAPDDIKDILAKEAVKPTVN
jgi:type III restriction enzyme